jgi:hypothetical protein
MTYSERLRALKLPSLSYRKLRGDMIEVYKIINLFGRPSLNPFDLLYVFGFKWCPY